MKVLLSFLLVLTLLRAEPLTPARVAQQRAQILANFFVPDPLPALAAKTHRSFAPAPGVAADYLALIDEGCRPVERATAATIVVTAARVGPVRLIDNVILGEGVAADPTVSA